MDWPGCLYYRTDSTQVISLRISISLLWFETCFITITGAWRRGREDSDRRWPLYSQVSVRDPMTELAEPSQEKSAPRIGTGDRDFGDTDIERRVSHESEIREDFRGA